MLKMIKIVEDYMKDTSSSSGTAIMLNGPRGAGKTYFVRNRLILVLGKKKSAYVSLNGVNSVDEINDRVQLSLLGCDPKVYKNSLLSAHMGLKTVNMGSGILAFVRDILLFIPGIVKGIFVYYRAKSRLLIVDDLERISDDLSINAVFGYFSRYYLDKRKGKGKVLFVCTEGEIKDLEYKKVKEKYVKRTIEFEPQYEAYFDSVTKDINLEDSKQFFAVKENMDTMIELFRTAEIENLRIVESVVKDFNVIMGGIAEEVDNALAMRLWRMITMLTNETLLGNPQLESAAVIDAMEQCNISIVRLVLISIDRPDIGQYLSSVVDKYFKGVEYQWLYLKSVHDSIRSGHDYDKERILGEIKSLKIPAIEALNQFYRIPHLDTEEDVQRVIMGLREHILCGDETYDENTLYSIFRTLQNGVLSDSDIDHSNIEELKGLVVNEFGRRINKHTSSIQLYLMYNSIGPKPLEKEFEEAVKPIYDKKMLQLQKACLRELLESLDCIKVTKLVDKIRSGRLFSKIIEYDFADLIYKMNSSKLRIFGAELVEIKNPYTDNSDLIQKEIDSIQTIIDGFGKHMQDKPWEREAQEKFIVALEEFANNLDKCAREQKKAPTHAENKADGNLHIDTDDDNEPQ